MSQSIVQISSTALRLLLPGAACFLLVGFLQADSTRYRQSAHGSPSSGVLRIADYPRGSCAQCHSSHEAGLSNAYGLFEMNSNRLCLSSSQGGCHADRPSGATAGYPAQETDRMPSGSSDPGYFEYNSGGVKIPGLQNLVRWPGEIIWQDPIASPHFASPAMPIQDRFGNGACINCHAVHGGANAHDLLDTTSRGVVGSEIGFRTQNYALCLNCHSQFGPPGMDDSGRMIASYYDKGINPAATAGHAFGGSGYVPSGARMPCFDCHNVHGSAGNGNAGPNGYLISDQRTGWYGLTNIKNNNEQVRRFCFGCHRSSDGIGGETVEGILPEPLPTVNNVHQFADATHCYDCHGRDYSSPTSNNVHNPRVPEVINDGSGSNMPRWRKN